MIAEQDAYRAEIVAAHQMRNRFGNKRRKIAAARKKITTALSALGYSDEAISIARKDAYDMALLDLQCEADEK